VPAWSHPSRRRRPGVVLRSRSSRRPGVVLRSRSTRRPGVVLRSRSSRRPGVVPRNRSSRRHCVGRPPSRRCRRRPSEILASRSHRRRLPVPPTGGATDDLRRAARSTPARATESLPRVGRVGGGRLPSHRRPGSISPPAGRAWVSHHGDVRPTHRHPHTGDPVRRSRPSAATVPSPRRPARSAPNPHFDAAPTRRRGVSSSHLRRAEPNRRRREGSNHLRVAVPNRHRGVGSSRFHSADSSRRGVSSSRHRRAEPNRHRGADSNLRHGVSTSHHRRAVPNRRHPAGAVPSRRLRPAAMSFLPAAANRHLAGPATPPPTSHRPGDRKRHGPPGRAGSGGRELHPADPPCHRPRRRTTAAPSTRNGRARRIGPSHRIGRPGDGPFGTIRYRHRLRPLGMRPVRHPGGRGRSRRRRNGHGADRPS
jgi:hypothetical protein